MLQKNLNINQGAANWNPTHINHPSNTNRIDSLNPELDQQDNLENLTFDVHNNNNKLTTIIDSKIKSEQPKDNSAWKKGSSSEERLVIPANGSSNSNRNLDKKECELKSEVNCSLEIDTDIGSNKIKVDTIKNHKEASPIENCSKEDEKANKTANTHESSNNSSKILIKDLINYNVKNYCFFTLIYILKFFYVCCAS